MFKFLKEVVSGVGAGTNDFPYNIGEAYVHSWGSWTHCRGTSKDDGSPVSIFSLSGSSADEGQIIAGRNGVKRLRTVRHPNVLAFLHSVEIETVDVSVPRITIYMVTEPVMPLCEKLSELGLEGEQRDEYYAWGLLQIAKALSFLNNDCKLVHGNVCLDSVVVTPTLDWKLHAFDVLSEFTAENEATSGPLLQYQWLIKSQYKPLELIKCDWDAIKKSPTWSIDSWGLGCLIFELFSGVKLNKTEDLRGTASIPKTLLKDYQRLLSSVPSRRLNAARLAENSEFFQNKLVDTINFVEVLNLKDSIEKDTFFRKLPKLAELLPRQIIFKKLLPLLSSALEFGSASATALNAVLRISSLLSDEEFRAQVLPTLVKLFSSNDRAIRVCLLQHIDQYGNFLSSEVVDEKVFPNVATGFCDTSAVVRGLTLESMLVLAPKLSQRLISTSLLKYLSKLQLDEEPTIRTNTTILLGNIAGYLNDSTRKRILINAFVSRAFRDTFSPAKVAALTALCATCAFYDAFEIGTKILPKVIELTFDSDSDVRSKALQTFDQFVQIFKNEHEKIASDTPVAIAGVASGPVNTGLIGRALSSFTLKGKHVQAYTNSDSMGQANSSISNDEAGVPSVVETSHLHSNSMELQSKSYPSGTLVEIDNVLHEESRNENGWNDDFFLETEQSHAFSTTFAHKQLSVEQFPESEPQGGLVVPNNTVGVLKIDDTWDSVAESAQKNASKVLNSKSHSSCDDPWDSIAAPPPTVARSSLVSRGNKASVRKLGAQRIKRSSS